MIEDGGEMLVATLMVWYVFLLALHKGGLEVYLHQSMNPPAESRREPE